MISGVTALFDQIGNMKMRTIFEKTMCYYKVIIVYKHINMYQCTDMEYLLHVYIGIYHVITKLVIVVHQ